MNLNPFSTFTFTTHHKLVQNEKEQPVNKATTRNTCYNWVCLMDPLCHRWTRLYLIQYTHKVKVLLRVLRSSLQVNQNVMKGLMRIMTGLTSSPKFCATNKIDRLLLNLVSTNSFFKTLFKWKQTENKFFHYKSGISQKHITDRLQFIRRVLKDAL